jgi:hypothetical protein
MKGCLVGEKSYGVRPKTKPEDVGKWISEALQGTNKYLAIINCRLEIPLHADLPEYIKPDLISAYQAEKDASRILRNLNGFCRKSF